MVGLCINELVSMKTKKVEKRYKNVHDVDDMFARYILLIPSVLECEV